MNYVFAAFLVVGFLGLMKSFGLMNKSIRVINIAKSAVSDLKDRALDDDAKEVLIQAHAKKLFVLFALIVLGSAGAVFLPVALLVLGDAFGWLSLEAAFAALASWEFLVPATLISVYFMWLVAKS